MNFRDTAYLYSDATEGDYGKLEMGTPTAIPCIYEQETGYAHAGSQDSVTGTPFLVFPPGNSELQSLEYRLEGMVVRVNPFGADQYSQFFRISSVRPMRDTLLGNQLKHVECALAPVDVGNQAVLS